jgi:predicted glycogen debranching enzyme
MISAPAENRSEWLEADGLGGFASGTVCGLRTRRYHALLLAATTPPSGRMVLVNGLEAEWISGGKTIALSTQRYLPGVDTPDGATRLKSFTTEPWPQWIFDLPDGGRITQEIFVPYVRAAVVVRWRAEKTTGQLRVRPFFSGRDFHALHHENPNFNFVPENIPAGNRWHFYPGVPPVLARSNGRYQHEPCWYRQFLYDEEVERGLDAVEDLAAPGTYLFPENPAVLIFSAKDSAAGNESLSAIDLAEKWAASETSRRAVFPTPRHRAADAYLVKRGAGKTIIAGYPWFGDWGRDTFISMRGLCLATGRLDEARDILVAWAGTVSQGMLPNRFPDTGDAPEYNSVDASLWYILVVHEFLEATNGKPGREKKTLLAAVDSILNGYTQGTRFGIRADTDGLLACGMPGVQMTWMDAKVGDWVVTPRIGKPVEVQALWLNALALAGRYDPKWLGAYEKGRAAFEQRFWNESRGCLYDVVDCDHQPGVMDDRLRPNQLFAVGGLPIAFFDGDRARSVVQLAEDRLWTPMGPRSLAPGEKDYAAHYRGDPLHRDGAYHQGTVWPWLTGPFLEARIRVGDGTAEAKAAALALLEASDLLRSDLQGLNHVPEIADAETPHIPRGCPFQAWSLGEILRLELKILQR